jgi:hypothetical protein
MRFILAFLLLSALVAVVCSAPVVDSVSEETSALESKSLESVQANNTNVDAEGKPVGCIYYVGGTPYFECFV